VERSSRAAEQIVLAMVALNRASLDGQKVVDRLRARFGDEIVSPPSTSSDGIVQFTLEGRANIFLTPIPLPIPWVDLEGPCAAASTEVLQRWPEATEVMRAHKEHVLVVLSDAPPKIIGQRIGLTHVVSAVLSTTDAAGVYWGEGPIVHEPKVFIEEAKAASLESIPYGLWVDLCVTRGSKPDTITVFTQGLRALGHREIEVVDSCLPPLDVIAKIEMLVDYLLDQGPIIGDGQTFGATDEERILVRFAASILPRDDVMRLAL
jgi:hypothetical protein